MVKICSRNAGQARGSVRTMSSSEGTYHTAENRSRAQTPDLDGPSSQHDQNPHTIANFLETFVPRQCRGHGNSEDSRRSTPRPCGWGHRNREGNDDTMWYQNRRNGMDGGNDHGSHNVGGTTADGADETATPASGFPLRVATNPLFNSRFHGGNSGGNGPGFRASNGRVQQRGPTQNPSWAHAHARPKKRHQNQVKHQRGGSRPSGRQQSAGQASGPIHHQPRGHGRNRSGRIARPHRNGEHPNLNNYNDRGAVQETLRPFLPWPEYFDDNEAVPSAFVRPVQYPRGNYQSERPHENSRAPQQAVNFYSDRQSQDAGEFSGGIGSAARVETNRNIPVQGPSPYQHTGVRPQRSAGYRTARTREIPIVNPRSGLPIRREEVRRSTVRRNPGAPGVEGSNRGQGIRFGSFELIHRPAIRTGGLNPLAPAFTPSSNRPEINVLVELQVRSNLSAGLTAEEFSSIKDVFIGVDIPLDDLKQIVNEECLCAICCGPMEDGDHAKQLPCSDVHIFHSKCIWRWTQNVPTCPLCRQNLRDKIHASPSPSPVERNRNRAVNADVEVPELSIARNRAPLARQVAGEFRDQIRQLHLLGEELANDLREGIEEDLTRLVLDQLDEHLDEEEVIGESAREAPHAGWSSEMALSRRWIQVENEGQDPLSPVDSLDILRRRSSAPPSHVMDQGGAPAPENQQEAYFPLTHENLMEFGSPENVRGRLIGRYLDNVSEIQRQQHRPSEGGNAELDLMRPPAPSQTQSPVPSTNSEETTDGRNLWSPSLQFAVSAQANRNTDE
ncbi:hypothetical protein BSKO_10708 [Bryopsis sp. KO-2023]|nr:hypothetical protein BSKO_10708 [Bryopsis sp. KO-2023]